MRHLFLLSLAISTLIGCTANATEWVGTGIPSAHYDVTRHIDWTVQTPVDMKAGGDGAYSIGGMDWTATTTAQCSEMSISAAGLTIATTAALKGLPQLIAEADELIPGYGDDSDVMIVSRFSIADPDNRENISFAIYGPLGSGKWAWLSVGWTSGGGDNSAEAETTGPKRASSAFTPTGDLISVMQLQRGGWVPRYGTAPVGGGYGDPEDYAIAGGTAGYSAGDRQPGVANNFPAASARFGFRLESTSGVFSVIVTDTWILERHL